MKRSFFTPFDVFFKKTTGSESGWSDWIAESDESLRVGESGVTAPQVSMRVSRQTAVQTQADRRSWSGQHCGEPGRRLERDRSRVAELVPLNHTPAGYP